MSPIKQKYDVAIIGGGLAGLTLSIQLSKEGYEVILFEKEKYPFHKVCGEYISNESKNFLLQLGLPIKNLELSSINQLQITAPNGKLFTTELPLGGFGISRYKLDFELAQIAIQSGVTLLEETKAEDVIFTNDEFEIIYKSNNKEEVVRAKICCGAYGKRSNLDIKWKRSFLQKHDSRINNYVGVKYHVQLNWPEQVIGLHNFKNGYCGISKIEDDKYCLCYMTKAENLKHSENSITQLQEKILYQNPALKKIFTACTFLQDFPVTISQISFSKKSQVEEHVMMLGDAAGMITPLCGNGMSMAMHSSKILFLLLQEYFGGKISRLGLEKNYQKKWENEFSRRLKAGRILQSFFGKTSLSNIFIQLLKIFPFIAKPIIKLTHGKSF